MHKFGLKLWPNDFVKTPEIQKECLKSIDEGYFSFVELAVLPNSYDEIAPVVGPFLKDYSVVIHAPHSGFGFVPSNKERRAENTKMMEDASRFADLLKAEIIVLHPGSKNDEGGLEETIYQMNQAHDSRIAVENMPAQCNSSGLYFQGDSIEDIQTIMRETGYRFCFDIAHALCAANTHKKDVWEMFSAYQALNPVIYHLCDGGWSAEHDKHLHLLEGDYQLQRVLNEVIFKDALITMETGWGGKPESPRLWVEDVKNARSMMG